MIEPVKCLEAELESVPLGNDEFLAQPHIRPKCRRATKGVPSEIPKAMLGTRTGNVECIPCEPYQRIRPTTHIRIYARYRVRTLALCSPVSDDTPPDGDVERISRSRVKGALYGPTSQYFPSETRILCKTRSGYLVGRNQHKPMLCIIRFGSIRSSNVIIVLNIAAEVALTSVSVVVGQCMGKRVKKIEGKTMVKSLVHAKLTCVVTGPAIVVPICD